MDGAFCDILRFVQGQMHSLASEIAQDLAELRAMRSLPVLDRSRTIHSPALPTQPTIVEPEQEGIAASMETEQPEISLRPQEVPVLSERRRLDLGFPSFSGNDTDAVEKASTIVHVRPAIDNATSNKSLPRRRKRTNQNDTNDYWVSGTIQRILLP
jgi:septal ring-binding cell division protein DamX